MSQIPPATSTPRIDAVSWGLLLVLSAVWGGSFYFAKIAVAEVPPFTLVFVRVAIAATALRLALWIWRVPVDGAAGRAFWIGAAGMGLLNNAVPFTLIFWGQTQIASALASVLNATTPIFTAVLAHLLTRDDRLTAPKLAGLLIGLGGVTTLLGPAIAGGADAGLWGVLACLGAAMSYGLSAVWARRLRGLPPLRVAAGQLTLSSLMMLPVALAVDHPWTLPLPHLPVVAAILALALVSTAVAYVLFFMVLTRAGASNVVLVTLMIPAWATMLGVGLLGEHLTPPQIAGLALIALALLVIDGRVVRRARRYWTGAGPATASTAPGREPGARGTGG